MKKLTQVTLLFTLLIGFSCRETKQDEAQENAELKDIDAVEAEVEVIGDNINKKEVELEEALKDLDSL